MKKKRFISLIIVLAILLSCLFFYHHIENTNTHMPNNSMINTPFYPTVHEAIENELNTKIYKAVQSNETCFAVCYGTANGYICQYLYKTANGWQIITETVCENPVVTDNNQKCSYAVYDYMGKYIICISQNFLSKESYGKLEITDSLNSNFINLNYKSLNLYNTDYWYICLDSLPEDYTIFLNGEPTFKPLKHSFTDKVKAFLNK